MEKKTKKWEKEEVKKEEKETKEKKKCKCDETEVKIKELEEAILRKEADLINYRKRKDEEVERTLKYANEDIAKDLLPIVDNFERAISLDDDNLDDELSKFLEGFKMIYCHLTDVLNKFEVKSSVPSSRPY